MIAHPPPATVRGSATVLRRGRWLGGGWLRSRLRACGLAAGLALAVIPCLAAGPSRVVSLNLCTDQLLVLLADREAIASISFLAADPDLSYVADRIAGLPLNHGLAEEILTLAPDLVLAGTYGAGPTVALLRARGVPVVQIGLADDFAAIAAQTRTVAAAIGVPERGEALLDRMDRALAAAAPAGQARRPDAAVYQANGFTAGTGTLADAVLAAAGFDNVAAAAGLAGYGYLPLETLVTVAPDALIIDLDAEGTPSLAHALLRHPALVRLADDMPTVALPNGTLACGGPYTAEAVTALADLREALLPLPPGERVGVRGHRRRPDSQAQARAAPPPYPALSPGGRGETDASEDRP